MESFSCFINYGSIKKASVHELKSVTPTRDSNDLVVIGKHFGDRIYPNVVQPASCAAVALREPSGSNSASLIVFHAPGM
jgi:hypothetical protein